MSGICGIVRFNGQAVKKEDIQSMLDAMNDNNDTQGIWIDCNVGFGHKMLWTTPESLLENQPSENMESNLVITADVRIDNRNELFEKLGINDDLKIVTDVDLILLSYQIWGEECSKYLKGDFAFAIWDKSQKKLYCARDRFGIKPFYFYFSNEMIYFSSDIDSLLTIIDEPIAVNNKAIRSFGKFATIGYEETMYENIFRIPPAFSFVFSDEGLNKYRYWFPEKIKINYDVSFEEAKQKIYNLLSEAVTTRLRVYGDWGCELSGGLDSTAVSLIAQNTTKSEFKTFSMRYQSYSCDEWKYTKKAIDTLGSIPIVLDADKLDVKNKYNLYSSVKLNKHWPQYGSFIYNYVLGKKMVENDIRVCLTGHGGDHVFTGSWHPTFEYFKNFRFTETLDGISDSDKTLFESLISTIKTLVPRKIKSFLKKFLLKQESHYPENFIDYWNLASNKSDTIKSNLYYLVGRQHVMHTDNNYYRVLESTENIEFRHPFFDTNLIEYVLTLPNYYKYKNGKIKVILREALKDLYPSSIYEREDKAEFSEALLAQINAIDVLQVWKHSLLIKNELIDQTYLHELMDQYQNNLIGSEGVGNLWRMISLELWLDNKIK